MKTKKYHCSIHKDIGNSNCNECLRNLKKLCDDNNALLFDEKGVLK